MTNNIREYTFEDMALSQSNQDKSEEEKLYTDIVNQYNHYKAATRILFSVDVLIILVTVTLILLGVHPVQSIEHTERITMHTIMTKPFDKCSVIILVNTLLILLPISLIFIIENIANSLDIESAHRKLIEYYRSNKIKLKVYPIDVKLKCKSCKKTASYNIKPLYSNTKEQSYSAVSCIYCNKPIDSLVDCDGHPIKLEQRRIRIWDF